MPRQASRPILPRPIPSEPLRRSRLIRLLRVTLRRQRAAQGPCEWLRIAMLVVDAVVRIVQLVAWVVAAFGILMLAHRLGRWR